MNLPIILSKQVTTTILDEFNYNHGSFVSFMNQFKVVLAHHFTMPGKFLSITLKVNGQCMNANIMMTYTILINTLLKGSFLALLGNESFMDKFKNHITWFLVDPNSRKRIMVKLQKEDTVIGKKQDVGTCTSHDLVRLMQTVFEERSMISLICNMLTAAQVFLRSSKVSASSDKPCSNRPTSLEMKQHVLMTGAYFTQSEQYKLLIEKLFEFIRNAPKQEITKLFDIFIQVANDHLSSLNDCQINRDIQPKECDGNITSEKMIHIVSFFDSTIIFLDQVPNDMLWDLREWIVEEICSLLSYRTTAPLSGATYYGRLDRIKAFATSISTRPRHDLASALGNPDNDEADDLILDMQVAFNVFDSRVIQIEEWFRRFTERRILDSKEKRDSKAGMLQSFAFCVYQLILCGLVVRSRRVENGFEKAALVWASL